MAPKKNWIGKAAKVDETAVLCPPVRVYGKTNIQPHCRVGKYTYLADGCYLTAGAEVGNYCAISRNVDIGGVAHPTAFLSCHPFQYNSKHFDFVEGYSTHRRVRHSGGGEARIGHDVWIGTKAVIKAGIEIGTGAVIGAASVVTKSVPPYAVVVGAPAKVLRYRFEPPLIERLLASQWWELEPVDLDGLPFDDVPMALDQISRLRQVLTEHNRSELRKELSNAASGTAKGILWVPTEKAYADRLAFEPGQCIEVTEVAQDVLFNGMVSDLRPGRYTVTLAAFDDSRGCYRLCIRDKETPYSGPLGQGAVKFRLVDSFLPPPNSDRLGEPFL
jgi:acetyltransferase-like isoleucine patch superfamily enzyme